MLTIYSEKLIMKFTTLSTILADMYFNAPKGDKAVMVHLFGIKYARDIQACDETPKQLAIAARLNESYATEIAKGIRLAQYVWPKPE